MAKQTTTSASEARTVTSKELLNLLKITAIGARRPAFIWGPPGIGKSDIVQQLGDENDAHVIDVRLSLWDPTDIKGIPYFNTTSNKMEWAPSSELPDEEFAANYKLIILFFDEMNSAAPSVQAAAYQLVLNRRIGTYKLPDNVVIIAAGNRETDKGVTYRMPAPLANRFVHFEMRVDYDNWQEWAIDHGVHQDVVGFLSQHKTDLFQFEPGQAGRAFATPRSWVFVSDILKQIGSDESDRGEKMVNDIISGAVGEGVTHKFNTHRKWAGKLPLASDICTGKAKKLDVKEISAHFSLVINLIYEIKDMALKGEDINAAMDNILRFIMDNLSPEFVVVCVMSIVRSGAKFSIQKLKNYTEFHDKYGKYVTTAAS